MNLLKRLRAWEVYCVITDTLIKSKHNIASLDGFRGIAALLVVVEHSRAFGLDDVGRFAVYSFFVLSAFLLSSQFLEKQEESFKRDKLITYLKKRFLRIIPLYWTVIMVTSVLQLWDLEKIIKHLLFMRGDGIYWALPQEFWFYFILPLIMWLIINLRKRSRFLPYIFLMISIYTSSNYLTTDIIGFETPNSFRPWLVHVFLYGVLAALAFKDLNELSYLKKKIDKKTAIVFAISAISSIVNVSLVLANSNSITSLLNLAGLDVEISSAQYPYSVEASHIIGFGCGLLLLMMSLSNQNILSRMYSILPFRILGTLSFSIYLLHIPFIDYYRLKVGYEAGKEFFGLISLATIIVSIFSYTYVERRFIQYGRSRRPD